ncbi:cellulose biosynthesis protein BcsD [Musicola paradisiaca]|uniref:Cellulose synthase operon protein D n=1 Tax=Musicola paradisiaca (strain Ech703) TaxID=579405 RepID=C6C636_MUSP7|nr:cellulose biosynthesis protein BcsD [Musicola paradisiaca]ACS87645.1 cellulose synthase operon protein D [Musicola paradisiaca Ech703]
MSELQVHAMNYYLQQQRQAGWTDLFDIIVNGMMANAGEQESQLFLSQMGAQLAERYPLPIVETVAELEQAINSVLAEFHWGCVDLRPYDNRLEILHIALPAAGQSSSGNRWRLAMGAVLQGMYSRWLRLQGGGEQVPMAYQETEDGAVLLFRYQNRTRGES